MRSLALVLVVFPLSVLAAAPVDLPPASAEEARSMFPLPSGLPLDVKELGRERRDRAEVLDVTFAGADAKDTVRAYVVRPVGPGPFAGVVWMHWLGEPATTNRTQFLDEAVRLATQGVVSVLPDAMWSAPQWYKNRVHAEDVRHNTREVVRVRRALEVLRAQQGVDAARIAYVGHDFGAMFGMLAGAADGGPKAYVFMAPTPKWTDWYLYGPKKPKDLEAYARGLAPQDPVRFVGALAPARVFFQFADRDKYVPADKAAAFVAAAAEPKLSRTYVADHQLDVRTGARDRFEFLVRHLGLQAAARARPSGR